MRNREVFSNLITVPPVFIRIDGRSFHRLAKCWNLEQPFDPEFSKIMAEVGRRLVTESGLSPEFAYTFSDEINLYFSDLPFKGRVEKIDSVAASFAASCLVIGMGSAYPVSFDARIIQVTPDLALEYLINRQSEAWRNHLNSYCQNELISSGISRREAARHLKGMPSKEMHEMMFKAGVNLSKTPVWQRRGVLVYKRKKTVKGFNPKIGTMTDTIRTSVVIERDLPQFTSPEGRSLLTGLLDL
ncbi:MAG TPA: tRNA(His) guanylyltransferase Thg1 family protein [Methanoregulaceae archaeon]|nr:tRNA(His) guanylyltransferase Thg1 family protein [Methanoregulaceae archaeon]